MDTCDTCGEPVSGVFPCHHHSTNTTEDGVGNTVEDCEDCPAWWLLRPEED